MVLSFRESRVPSGSFRRRSRATRAAASFLASLTPLHRLPYDAPHILLGTSSGPHGVRGFPEQTLSPVHESFVLPLLAAIFLLRQMLLHTAVYFVTELFSVEIWVDFRYLVHERLDDQLRVAACLTLGKVFRFRHHVSFRRST